MNSQVVGDRNDKLVTLRHLIGNVSWVRRKHCLDDHTRISSARRIHVRLRRWVKTFRACLMMHRLLDQRWQSYCMLEHRVALPCTLESPERCTRLVLGLGLQGMYEIKALNRPPWLDLSPSP